MIYNITIKEKEMGKFSAKKTKNPTTILGENGKKPSFGIQSNILEIP